jgi:single-stranded DNA-binding protein
LVVFGNVSTFAVTTNECAGNGHQGGEHHAVLVWDRLAEIRAMYLGKGQQVAVEGKLQTWSLAPRGMLGAGAQ